MKNTVHAPRKGIEDVRFEDMLAVHSQCYVGNHKELNVAVMQTLMTAVHTGSEASVMTRLPNREGHVPDAGATAYTCPPYQVWASLVAE